MTTGVAAVERTPRLPRRTTPEWVDRLLASDPGLLRLRIALQTVVTIGIAMLAERVFVSLTHALQIDTHGASLPPEQAALVAAQHHGMLVIAIMLGAMLGMMAAFTAGMFADTRTLLINFALMPVFMIAGLAVGLSLAKVPSRTVSLAALVVLLAAGAYCRRFGPLGIVAGMLVFIGDFFGFFLNGTVTLGDLGWLAAEITLGVLVAALCQFTIFRAQPRKALQRLRRSFEARAATVVRSAVDLFEQTDAAGPGASRRMRRDLIRLNETALLIDAQLNDSRSVPPGVSPAALHQVLFDAELAVTNMARFAAQLARSPLPTHVRDRVIETLTAVATQDLPRAEAPAHGLLDDVSSLGDDRTVTIVLHRFAISVLGYLDAVTRGAALTSDPTAEPFASPVITVGGWLPGAAIVSEAASNEPGPTGDRPPWLRPWQHVAIPGNVRVTIQMSIAVTAAVALGDLVSGRRFYWAVIASWVTFMGASNSGEQVRKGSFRVLGTAVGVVLGGIGAHLVGRHTNWAIAVILAALFLGMYFMRISYAFMVVGVTVMVSQLYVQLDEYSNSMLLLRLGETALGAGVTALVVLFVLPLRSSRVARTASRSFLEALDAVLDAAVDNLGTLGRTEARVRLRAELRALDNSYQAYVSAVASVRTPLDTSTDQLVDRFQQSMAATRHYARNLLVDTSSGGSLPPDALEPLRQAHERLTASLAVLITALGSEPGARTDAGAYVRSAALFDQIATQLDSSFTDSRQLAIRDLQLIDGALATLAEHAGLPVQALDTTPV